MFQETDGLDGWLNSTVKCTNSAAGILGQSFSVVALPCALLISRGLNNGQAIQSKDGIQR